VVPEQDGDRQLGDLVLLLGPLEVRGLRQRPAHPVADGDDEGGEEEGDPPAPAEQLVLGQQRDREEDQVGQDQTGLGALEGEAGEEAAPALGGVLQRHRVGAALLAGGRQPLQDPHQHEQDRGGHADGGVGRDQADGEGGDAHQQQGEDQHLLAAEHVAEVADDDRADGAGHVRDAEGGQREQDAGGRLALGEEHLREHQPGGGAVDEEVVVLQHAADEAGQGRLLRLAHGGRGAWFGRAHEIS
jgi:hypothetical protein